MPLFTWMDYFLYFWAEILTIFSLQFWKILDLQISFWNKLTFRGCLTQRPKKAKYRKAGAWPSKVLTVVHIWGEWSEKQCQLKGRCIQQRYRSLPKRDFFRPKLRSGIDRYFLFRQTGPLCSLKIKKFKKSCKFCIKNNKVNDSLFWFW